MEKHRNSSNDDFYYGHRIDNYGNDTLVIDLPVYGQISVHFGSKSNMEQVLHIAKQSAQKIMQRKLELGQISQKEYEELFTKWILAEPIISETFMQIPVRIFCKHGSIDVIMLVSIDNSKIYQIKISKWIKNDEK